MQRDEVKALVSKLEKRCDTQNDIIQRNGVASKMQCDEVKALVSNLKNRLDAQSKSMADM